MFEFLWQQTEKLGQKFWNSHPKMSLVGQCAGEPEGETPSLPWAVYFPLVVEWEQFQPQYFAILHCWETILFI